MFEMIIDWMLWLNGVTVDITTFNLIQLYFIGSWIHWAYWTGVCYEDSMGIDSDIPFGLFAPILYIVLGLVYVAIWFGTMIKSARGAYERL